MCYRIAEGFPLLNFFTNNPSDPTCCGNSKSVPMTIATAAIRTSPFSIFKNRNFSLMWAGHFVSTINHALTGRHRTTVVVPTENTTVMQIPSQTLRGLMDHQLINHLFFLKKNERLQRTFITNLRRFAGLDQDSLREFHTFLTVTTAEVTAQP